MAATAAQLAALVQAQQTSEAIDLETRTNQETDGGSSDALAAVLTAALAGWVAAFGAVGAAAAGAALTAYLAGVRRDIDRATHSLDRRASRSIAARLDEAADMGARHALDFAARASGVSRSPLHVTAPDDAIAAARGAADVVREQLRISARLLERRSVESGGWSRVLTGIAAARRAVTLAVQAGSWAIHRAINAGSAQATDALRAERLWVAEPTACVRCAAYSGRTADRGGSFPGGLSLDPRQRHPGAAAVDGPPIHPHDRCRIVPWLPQWAPDRGPALPDLLRNQALRSAATGNGQPSESRAARLRAAQYVASQPGTPADVRRRARTAVAAGHF